MIAALCRQGALTFFLNWIVVNLLASCAIVFSSGAVRADSYDEVYLEHWPDYYTETDIKRVTILAKQYCEEAEEFPSHREKLNDKIATAQMYGRVCERGRITDRRGENIKQNAIIGQFCEDVWSDQEINSLRLTEMGLRVICQGYNALYETQDDESFFEGLWKSRTKVDDVYAETIRRVTSLCHEWSQGRIKTQDARFKIVRATKEGERALVN